VKAFESGKASVVTDHIDHFTETGIALKSGKSIEADVVVTATGLVLQHNFPMSTCAVTIDGRPYEVCRGTNLPPQRLPKVILVFRVFVSGITAAQDDDLSRDAVPRWAIVQQ